MKLPRRKFLHLAAGAAALPAVPHPVRAQTYPARPVRLLTGFQAGGGQDIIARLVGQWLSDRLGQPFVIENRPGAATNIATEVVVKSPPDGHTLLLFGATATINATLYDKLSFNFSRDIAPVASLVGIPLVMGINPSFPAKTVAEFVAHARANPGKISMGSAGTGSAGHMSGELFKMMARVDLLHVPYRGEAPAIIDLLGGQVQVVFATLPAALANIMSGRMRALAVTTATRSDVISNIPTVADFVPGYEASAWNGVGAPRNTPAEIIEKLNREINAALADPKMKARLAELGHTVLSSTPADFGRSIIDEVEKWAKVIRAAGMKAE